jgi:hypothetical protein
MFDIAEVGEIEIHLIQDIPKSSSNIILHGYKKTRGGNEPTWKR